MKVGYLVLDLPINQILTKFTLGVFYIYTQKHKIHVFISNTFIIFNVVLLF